jgi:hypothetical protein
MTETTTPDVQAAGTTGEPEGAAVDDPTSEPESFTREYVDRLREESADHRVRAKRAEAATARLLDATIADATRGVLVDPTDLPREGDYFDDDGWPDAAKIRDAAEALAASKPHLGDRRPSTSIPQGSQPDAAPEFSLGAALRALA